MDSEPRVQRAWITGRVCGRKNDAKENLRVCAWSNCVAPLTAMEKSGGKLRMGRKINKSTLDVLKCLSESKMDTSNMYLICESRLRN